MFRGWLTLVGGGGAGFVCGTIGIVGRWLGVPGARDWAMRWFGRVSLWFAGAKLIVEGAEHLPAGVSIFFVGNHQSAIDIPAVSAATGGRIAFMAKKELFRLPLMGAYLRAYDIVPIDRQHPRKAQQAVSDMLARVANRPISIAVFPEGTRSQTGALLPFRQGTMKICQRAGMAVVAFAISGTLAVHRRGSRHVRAGTVYVRFARPIEAAEVQAMSSGDLGKRLHQTIGDMLNALPQPPARTTEASARDGTREASAAGAPSTCPADPDSEPKEANSDLAHADN